MIMSFKGFRHIAGAASAAYSCVQMLLCCLVSLVVAHLPMHNQFPLSVLIIGVSLTAVIVCHMCRRNQAR